jgi:hypothetical protein
MLCRLSEVGFDETAEFLSTSNNAFGLRHESLVEDLVLHAKTPMWSLVMIMPEPNRKNVVELFNTEAHEVV